MSCRANSLKPVTIEVYDYDALDELADDESSDDDEELGFMEVVQEKDEGEAEGKGKGKGKEVQAEGSSQRNVQTEELVGSDEGGQGKMEMDELLGSDDELGKPMPVDFKGQGEDDVQIVSTLILLNL